MRVYDSSRNSNERDGRHDQPPRTRSAFDITCSTQSIFVFWPTTLFCFHCFCFCSWLRSGSGRLWTIFGSIVRTRLVVWRRDARDVRKTQTPLNLLLQFSTRSHRHQPVTMSRGRHELSSRIYLLLLWKNLMLILTSVKVHWASSNTWCDRSHTWWEEYILELTLQIYTLYHRVID